MNPEEYVKFQTPEEFERWNDGPNKNHLLILFGVIMAVATIIVIVMIVFFDLK